MPLFASKNLSYLGIDLGGSSIKLVELKDEGGRPQLVTYGYIEKSTDIIKSNSVEAQKEIVMILKELIKKVKPTTMRTVTALPNFSVFSSIISFPTMSKKDLVSAVKWEAKKFVPMPIEEMILDWEILKSEEEKIEIKKETAGEKDKDKEAESKDDLMKEKKRGNIRVLLTAAPRNLVTRYIDIFKQVSLQLVGLETEAFALERSLIGHDNATIMVVDIGSLATSIMIFSEGIPLVSRSIDVGGETITNTLVNTLNIDPARAEQFKKDFGLSLAEREGTGQIPKAIEFVINSIVNEIRYVFNIYQNQKIKSIEKIILSGGSAYLLNLPSYLERIFDIKVFIGDPWARIIYPVELKPVLSELGSRFALSVGLAMRQIV